MLYTRAVLDIRQTYSQRCRSAAVAYIALRQGMTIREAAEQAGYARYGDVAEDALGAALKATWGPRAGQAIISASGLRSEEAFRALEPLPQRLSKQQSDVVWHAWEDQWEASRETGAEYDARIQERADSSLRLRVEQDWETWLLTLFPEKFRRRTGAPIVDEYGAPAPFAAHQQEFWEWLWGIQLGVASRPFVAIWARGGGKSTGAELGCVLLGATRRRRYGIYVSRTQHQAEEHVEAVSRAMESETFAAAYPHMADRAVGKYGFSRGWRRGRLATAGGFTLDALGLDKPVRGAKIGSERPDFVVLDDIDTELDTERSTERLITQITRRVLPAAGPDAAVLFIQNRVHARSVASRLCAMDATSGPKAGNGQIASEDTLTTAEPLVADMLYRRIVSGPHPALINFAAEQDPDTHRWSVLSGTPTWHGQGIEECETFINTYGIDAFRSECQHEDPTPKGSMFAKVPFRHCVPKDLPDLVKTVCWVDPSVTDKDGSDSCGIQISGIDADGVIYTLWSWEQRAGPREVLALALYQAVEFKCAEVGVETDQGGDLWEDAYKEVAAAYARAHPRVVAAHALPKFAERKAGAGHGPKAHRASVMKTDYERGVIVHVIGTHSTLEAALRRFPLAKPFDLVDAAYWAWYDLRRGGGSGVHFY